MRRFRPSPAMVVACISLIVALGSTATAAVVITSNGQVAQNTISGHKPPSGKHSNIIAGSINGKDIADRSGVDTCKTPLTKKFGPICAGSDGQARTWTQAYEYCRGFGLRLPTVGEAGALGTKYDVPGVASNEDFWTDDIYEVSPGNGAAAVHEDGAVVLVGPLSASEETVCVTDPSA